MVAYKRLYKVLAILETPQGKHKKVKPFVLRNMTLAQVRVVVRKTFRGSNVYGTVIELPSKTVHML